MFAWVRYAVLIALPLAVPSLALAQSGDKQRAAQLNDEGKVLWQEKNDLSAATDKFRQAIELDPDPRYYFNLCYSLHQLGRYEDALRACEGVGQAGGDEKQRKKAQVVIDDINSRLPKTPDPGDTGSTTVTEGGTPSGGGEPVGNGGETGATTTVEGTSGPQPGPIPGLYQPAELPDDYKWSAGFAVGPAVSGAGNKDLVGNSGAYFKAFANFMLVPTQRVGGQGYLAITSLGPANEAGEAMQIAELGAAFYKHIPLQRFYVTPLAGAHFTGFATQSSANEGFGTYGVHAEAAFSMLFGPDRRHVISVTPGLSIYFPATGSFAVADYGLNRTSGTFTVNIGYSLRFTTPFGQSTLITLE